MAHQGAAHGQHLLLAAGKGTGDLFTAFQQAREALINAFQVRLNAGGGLGKSAHLQVFLHRHLQKDMAAFRDLGQAHAHQLVGGDAVQVFSVKEDGAGAGLQKTRNVDLPAPLAPMRVTTSPSWTSKETPLTAWMLP